MKTATITMSLPQSGRMTSATVQAGDKLPLYAKLADVIRSYAARRGVSPRAVEYSIAYGMN